MSNQVLMRNQTIPLDFNNLGGANENNNFSQTYNNNNYNKMNSMNGYPRGSYMNENNNNNFNNNNYGMNENFQGQNQQNFSNTYNNNNYNQLMNNSQGINQNNNFRSPSPREIRMAEQEKKKMLLNNIQSQINLNKQTKLEQMNKNKEEDAKYLRDMMVHFPFGRGGGGAPIRDKSGNIITNRRALISDPKYNLASINVDDDYYEVWNKEKRIGRYYKNNNNDINNNNMNNNNNYNQQLSNTVKNFRGMQYNNNNNYQNNYNNNNQNYFNDNFQQNMGRPYSTNPRLMNNNMNNNFNNNYNNGQNMD